MTQKTGYTLV